MLIREIGEFVLDNVQKVEYELCEELKDGYRKYKDKQYIFIPYLGIEVYNVQYEFYCKETKEYELEFDSYMFLHTADATCVYEEQGSSLEACLHNYIRKYTGKDMSLNDIEDLFCELR